MKKVKQFIFLFFLVFVSSCQNNDSIEIIEKTNALEKEKTNILKKSSLKKQDKGGIKFRNDTQILHIEYLTNLTTDEKSTFREAVIRDHRLFLISWLQCNSNKDIETWEIGNSFKFLENTTHSIIIVTRPPGGIDTVGLSEDDDGDVGVNGGPIKKTVYWKINGKACSDIGLNGLP